MTPATRAAKLAAATLTLALLAACAAEAEGTASGSTGAAADTMSTAGWSSPTDTLPSSTSGTTTDAGVEDAALAPASVTSAAPESEAPDPNATATSMPTATATAPVERNLDLGSEGEDVLHLQQAMVDKGFWMPGTDGHYGLLTKQAVYAVQKAYGLTADGLAGPKTMDALERDLDLEMTTTSGKAVEIDVVKQLLFLVEDGKVVAILNTSTGNGEKFESEGVEYRALTPTGEFEVKSNNKWDWVEGPLGKMYKPAFFNGGIAFHGSAEIPPFPASHGCARLSKSAQDMVWEKGFAQVGTKVVVR